MRFKCYQMLSHDKTRSNTMKIKLTICLSTRKLIIKFGKSLSRYYHQWKYRMAPSHPHLTPHKKIRFNSRIHWTLFTLPSKLKETAFISLIRSILDYSSVAWNPYLTGDINKIENIQRIAGRFVKNDYSCQSNITSIMKDLKWQPLERRIYQRLTSLYLLHVTLTSSKSHLFLKTNSKTHF